MNTKTQNLPFRENQKNHRAYISANVRKTLDTTASARMNERLRASQRGDAFAMVFPTLTARNPLPTNVLYKKNIPMPQT